MIFGQAGGGCWEEVPDLCGVVDTAVSICDGHL